MQLQRSRLFLLHGTKPLLSFVNLRMESDSPLSRVLLPWNWFVDDSSKFPTATVSNSHSWPLQIYEKLSIFFGSCHGLRWNKNTMVTKTYRIPMDPSLGTRVSPHLSWYEALETFRSTHRAAMAVHVGVRNAAHSWANKKAIHSGLVTWLLMDPISLAHKHWMSLVGCIVSVLSFIIINHN